MYKNTGIDRLTNPMHNNKDFLNIYLDLQKKGETKMGKMLTQVVVGGLTIGLGIALGTPISQAINKVLNLG